MGAGKAVAGIAAEGAEGLGTASEVAEGAEGAGEATEAGDATATTEEGMCFIAGTPVEMANGKTEPIEQVKTGESLASRNTTTFHKEDESVGQTIIRTAHKVVELTLTDGRSTESITATPEHPFWVNGVGFVPAGALRIGECLTGRDGTPITVQTSTVHFGKIGYPVYNFSVEGDHTYFVGRLGGGVWVHNGDCPYDVYDPKTGDRITDIDSRGADVLWEEKSATWAQDVDKWADKHIIDKFAKFARARPHVPGYEGAGIGFRFTEGPIDPALKAAIESRIAALRAANPGIPIHVEWP